jgi:hypothetical protein
MPTRRSVGALFLDRGAEAVDRFVHDTLGDVLAAVVAVPPSPDPKTRLQVLLQARGRGLPSYEIVSAEGQGHSQRFVAEVRAGSEVLGRGEGPQQAERHRQRRRRRAGGARFGQKASPDKRRRVGSSRFLQTRQRFERPCPDRAYSGRTTALGPPLCSRTSCAPSVKRSGLNKEASGPLGKVPLLLEDKPLTLIGPVDQRAKCRLAIGSFVTGST